jgi:cytochrome P450
MDRSKLPEFSFRPFLSGPRACGGRRIADMELQVGLRLLLKHYAFENDGPETGFRYSLAFRPILTDRLKIHRLSGHPHA